MHSRRTPVLAACAVLTLVLAAAAASYHRAVEQTLSDAVAVHAAKSGNLAALTRMVRRDPALIHSRAEQVSLLGAALRAHQAAAVRMLLQRGVSPNGVYEGQPPLTLAVEWGNCDIVRRLLHAGADPNVHSASGLAPLHEAVGTGRADIAKLLLEHDADPNIVDIHLDTPLHAAVFLQNWAMAEQLVRAGSDMTRLDGFGFCPLDACLGRGNLHVVKVFLRILGDMNYRSRRSGDTPLLTLVMFRRIPLLKPIVQMGADINATGGSGEDPLGRAVRLRYRAVARAVWSLGGRGQSGPLFTAIDADALGRVAALIAGDPRSINRRDRWGDRPLHEAVLWGDRPMVTFLLQHGADVNSHDHADDTPLHEAALIGDTTITAILLAHGADIRAHSSSGLRQMFGETPLYRAAAAGHLGVAKQLVAAGADVNARNDQGRTPLFAAIRARSLPLAQLLVDHGASVRVADEFGNTPLHHAAFLGQSAMVALFLQHGAEINAVNHLHQTALHRALLFADMDTIRLLVRKGANLGLRDMRGNTPAEDAAVRNHPAAAAYLRGCEQTASRRSPTGSES